MAKENGLVKMNLKEFNQISATLKLKNIIILSSFKKIKFIC